MNRREAREAQELKPVRPVMMQFAYDHTVKMWRVVFRPRGASVPLPRMLYFADVDKLRELFTHSGSTQVLEDRLALESAINGKRGAVELRLGEAQLSRLRTNKWPTLNTEGGLAR